MPPRIKPVALEGRTFVRSKGKTTFLRINFGDRRLFGRGCNRFSLKYSLRGRVLRSRGQFVSTAMACPRYPEKQLRRLIRPGAKVWADGHRMRLKNRSGAVMWFREVQAR